MTTNLRRNAIWAVVEVVGSGLALFFLYRIIVGQLGIQALGIWSLVLATTSLGRFADVGMAAGLSRIVAVAEARQDTFRVLAYVETAIVTNFALYALAALFVWMPAYYGLRLAMPTDALVQAQALLPYSLASLVLMGIAGATTGAVVGQHQSHHKSIITLMGLAVQLLVVVLLVPRHGLLALGWAQIAQYALLIGAGWFLFLRNHCKRWSFRIPFQWRKDVFQELFRLGARLQVVSIIGMAYDPAVKFLMSAFGGLGALGYFEMAQRFILQARLLIVVPNQALVPTFAHLSEVDSSAIAGVYRKATVCSISFGVPLLAGLAIASPLVSFLWIGRIEATFVAMTCVLSLGWVVNVISTPAYLLGIGLGRVEWSLYGNVITIALACLMGLLLGRVAGGLGVASAASVALAAGGVFCMTNTCRSLGIRSWPRFSDFRSVLSGELSRWLKR